MATNSSLVCPVEKVRDISKQRTNRQPDNRLLTNTIKRKASKQLASCNPPDLWESMHVLEDILSIPNPYLLVDSEPSQWTMTTASTMAEIVNAIPCLPCQPMDSEDVLTDKPCLDIQPPVLEAVDQDNIPSFTVSEQSNVSDWIPSSIVLEHGQHTWCPVAEEQLDHGLDCEASQLERRLSKRQQHLQIHQKGIQERLPGVNFTGLIDEADDSMLTKKEKTSKTSLKRLRQSPPPTEKKQTKQKATSVTTKTAKLKAKSKFKAKRSSDLHTEATASVVRDTHVDQSVTSVNARRRRFTANCCLFLLNEVMQDPKWRPTSWHQRSAEKGLSRERINFGEEDGNDNDEDDEENANGNERVKDNDSNTRGRDLQAFSCSSNSNSSSRNPNTQLQSTSLHRKSKFPIREMGLSLNDIGSCPHTPFVTMKGIFQNVVFHQRVQLNSFLGIRKEKFSQNCRGIVEAVAVFELAILLSDCPPSLSLLLNSGNYNSLVSFENPFSLFRNPIEYILFLGSGLNWCRQQNIMSAHKESVVSAFNKLTLNACPDMSLKRLQEMVDEGAMHVLNVTAEHAKRNVETLSRVLAQAFFTAQSLHDVRSSHQKIFSEFPQLPERPRMGVVRESGTTRNVVEPNQSMKTSRRRTMKEIFCAPKDNGGHNHSQSKMSQSSQADSSPQQLQQVHDCSFIEPSAVKETTATCIRTRSQTKEKPPATAL